MLRNGIYNLLGTGINFALSILTIPLLIRLIGINDYGIWTLVTAILGIFSLAEAGLTVSTTVFLSKDLAQNNEIGISQTLTVSIGIMLLLATGVGSLMWWGAYIWVDLFPKLDTAQRLIAIQAFQLGGVVVWAKLLQQIMVGVLQALRRYDLSITIATGQNVILNIGLIIITWSGGRIISMMQWQVAVAILALVILTLIILRLLENFTLYPYFNKTRVQDLVRYSAMTWLVSLSSVLFSQFDRIIVGTILGTGVLGIYGAITSVASKINSLSAAPVQPLLPELSYVKAKPMGNYSVIRPQVQQAQRLNTVISLGLGIAFLNLAPVFIHFMLPNIVNTNDYVIVFQLTVIIYALYSPNAVGYYSLLSHAVKTCLTVQVASALTSLLLIALGSRTFGLLGAVMGNLGYLGIWLLTFFGMNVLSISISEWTKWVKTPLIWFFIMIMIGIILQKWVVLSLIISAIGILVLLSWWLSEEYSGFQAISDQLFGRKSLKS